MVAQFNCLWQSSAGFICPKWCNLCRDRGTLWPLNPNLVFYVLNTALLVEKEGLDLMAPKIIRSPFLLISWNSSPCRLLGMSTQNVILWHNWRKRRLNVWRMRKNVEMQHQQVSMCEEQKEWDRIDTLPESGHSHAANVRVWVSHLLSHIPVLWSALLPSTPIPFNYFLQYFFHIQKWIVNIPESILVSLSYSSPKCMLSWHHACYVRVCRSLKAG